MKNVQIVSIIMLLGNSNTICAYLITIRLKSQCL